jgi:hypothetical protein
VVGFHISGVKFLGSGTRDLVVLIPVIINTAEY